MVVNYVWVWVWWEDGFIGVWVDKFINHLKVYECTGL